MPGGLGVQYAAKYRLMEAKLLLDRARGQADLPSELTLPGRTSALDQPQLDRVRLVNAELSIIRGGEVDPLLPSLPKRFDQIGGVHASPLVALVTYRPGAYRLVLILKETSP